MLGQEKGSQAGIRRKKDPGKRKARLYPSLSELEESDISIHSGSDEEEEEEEDSYAMPLETIRKLVDRINIKRKERERHE